MTDQDALEALATTGVLENGATVADAIRPTLDRFVEASAPYLQKVTDELYERLLCGVQDYLRENGEWNIGVEIDRCRTIEADNRTLRKGNADLLDACTGLLGLLSLLAARDDVPADMRQYLTAGYRIDTALRAIAANRNAIGSTAATRGLMGDL